ncbi:MAG: protein kinase [Anaerolineales bacterium]|nr:protein kinase [Anaerolineales bacterium]
MKLERQLGRYQIRAFLGRGAMGEVYRAYDPHLAREVALKRITPPDEASQADWLRRFEREVQAAGRLNHPHLVTLYDVALTHNPPYVVMELLPGGSLQVRLKQHRLTWSQAVTLLLPLVEALDYAHRAGIVHRDVKPGNIMFGQGQPTDPFSAAWPDSLKLVDFGLAYQPDHQRLTVSGGVVGTPLYMSPEQASGQPVDARTDLYALGLILVEAITGRNPLDKGSLGQTWQAVTSTAPVDLSLLENEAPAALVAVIRQAVTRSREQRYSSASALWHDLTACLGQTSTLAQPGEATHLSTHRPTQPPRLENPTGLALPPATADILALMFDGYRRVVIREELGGGFSGSRVLLVRPIRDDSPELPAVVKISPLALLEQEWRAYQTCIRNRLPGVAEIKGQPVIPPGSDWGGLRYPLLGGGGVFEVESLARYYQRAAPADLRYLLTERLFKSLSPRWLFNRPQPEYHLQAGYDGLLPINLLIVPGPPPPDAPVQVLSSADIQPHAPSLTLQPGDYIRLEGFVITEVDPTRRSVTLNLPSSPGDFSPAYRLRLQPVEDIEAYRVHNRLDSVEGRITDTRFTLLHQLAQQVLGPTVDLSSPNLLLSNHRLLASSPPHLPFPASLPNPLTALPGLLRESRDVKIACVHGDLNLNNILVDPASREASLIDFALARQDHVLHDLLRLETGVVTRLLPEALNAAKLPAETIHLLYTELHCAAASPYVENPALARPRAMLQAIRQAAQPLLFTPQDWTEYYQGLTLYLLGALKYTDLDHPSAGSLPRQVAFWGAASAQALIGQPLPCPELLPPAAGVRPRWTYWAVALAGLLLLLVGLVVFWPSRTTPDAATAPLATIIDVKPEVNVKRANSDRLLPADFGLYLYSGDVVNTYAGAAATLICGNGLLFELPEQSNLTVACQESSDARLLGRLEAVLNTAPPNEISLTTEGQSRAPAARWSRLPLLLDPRQTVITTTRPTFRWQPVADAGGYRLSLSLPGGQSWSRETNTTSLTYPADAPPLAPGSANIVTLVPLNDETAADKSLLRVLDKAGQAELAEAETTIRVLPLDEAGQGYLLAQLYRQRELRSAAIAQLEALTGRQAVPSTGLVQLLGDLYFEVGLYAQAQESYQAALTTAETAANLSARAAAQVGLARVAYAFEDSNQAKALLEAAEALYRQAGEVELAGQVVAERGKLE